MSSFVDQDTIVFDIINFLFITSFLGWMYTLGINLHAKLPKEIKMNLLLFKILLIIPFVYMTILNFFVLGAHGNMEVLQNASPATQVLMILLHLISMFGMFYGLYFNAKALKSVTNKREVVFREFSKSFYLMWFFPIGIWFIQPTVNRLFEN